MITGIGVDAVYVKRMEKWILNQKLMEKFFHNDEVAYVTSRGKSAALSLAARFAAKEAFGKALGTGLSKITLKDIMVVNNGSGRPEIKLFNSARDAFEKTGANKAHISLTHEKDSAIAMVVLEKV